MSEHAAVQLYESDDNVPPTDQLDPHEYLPPQDVDIPRWVQKPRVGEWDPEEHPGVRTNGGGLDMLQHVQTDDHEWVEQTEHGAAHRVKPVRKNRTTVLNVPLGSDSLRLTTATVIPGSAQDILIRRDDRIRAVVTNWGPGILYVSHDTFQAGGALPGPSMAQIAVNGSREFRTRAALYGVAQAAQTCVIDVQDEYERPMIA